MKSVLAAAMWGSVLAFAAIAVAAPADFLLHGGTIHTLAGGEASTVEALAVRDGEVIAAGSLAELRDVAADAREIIDLHGNTVLPGLVDAHAHLLGLGNLLANVDLMGATSAEECVERARATAAKLAPGEWLFGRGWDQNLWSEQVFPTVALLDEAFGDRPVVFTRVDGHAIWVNSAAIRRAGVDAGTPDPEGGEIEAPCLAA